MVNRFSWYKETSKKLGELNEFLQGRVTGRAGSHVIDVAIELIQQLEAEKKRHEQALRFYGNRDNYKGSNYWSVVIDGGKKARQSLKGESE